MSGGMSLHDVVPGLEPSGDRRGSQRARKKRQKRRRRKAFVVLLVGLLVVGAGGFAAYSTLAPMVRGVLAPDDYEGAGTGEVEVTIAPGSTGRDIAAVLADGGVVKSPKAFVDASAEDSRAASIQPGTYRLRQQMSGASALELLLSPESRQEVRVTIPEGLRVSQVVDRLVKGFGFDKAAVDRELRNPAGLGLAAPTGGRPEGWLFPATYTFGPDVTPREVLTAMVAKSRDTMRELGVPTSQWRAVMTKASLVQAEARKPVDMGKVSRVLDNRIAAGTKLQLDSTVGFANNSFRITTTPQERQSTSPYNTYRYAGMPPGPINSPGAAAIKAALNPTPGPWMYFVAVDPDTGDTRYAVTGAQHQANVRLFQQWLAQQG